MENKVAEAVGQKQSQQIGKMKAMAINGFGGPEVLTYQDVPMPTVGPDDVLIKVQAAAINPIDWKIREGHWRGGTAFNFPFILGWDVAGTIEQTGALVTRFKKGDAVFSRPDVFRNGAYAEYIAVNAEFVAFAPESISPEQAAGVPLAAQTAWVGLFQMGLLKRGQAVLIQGAAGGVGTFAVQLAKIAGAHVTAITSTKNIELVKSLGADEVIDHSNGDFSKWNDSMDVVFDTVGGEHQNRLWATLRKSGILSGTAGVDEKKAAEYNVKGKAFMMQANGARLQEIAGLIDRRMLKVIIEKIFPLTDAAEAHKLSQSGKAKGKIILKVG